MADRTWMKLWVSRRDLLASKDPTAKQWLDLDNGPVAPDRVPNLGLGTDVERTNFYLWDVVELFDNEKVLPLGQDDTSDAHVERWNRGHLPKGVSLLGCMGNHYTYDSCTFSVLPGDRLPRLWQRSGHNSHLPRSGVSLALTCCHSDEWAPVVRHHKDAIQGGVRSLQSDLDKAMATFAFRSNIVRHWLVGYCGDWTG